MSVDAPASRSRLKLSGAAADNEGYEPLPSGSASLRPRYRTVGVTSWETSIFADAKSDSYLLPLKADARRREGIAAGDRVTVSLELRA